MFTVRHNTPAGHDVYACTRYQYQYGHDVTAEGQPYAGPQLILWGEGPDAPMIAALDLENAPTYVMNAAGATVDAFRLSTHGKTNHQSSTNNRSD